MTTQADNASAGSIEATSTHTRAQQLPKNALQRAQRLALHRAQAL
jgi:hypothetical protein